MVSCPSRCAARTIRDRATRARDLGQLAGAHVEHLADDRVAVAELSGHVAQVEQGDRGARIGGLCVELVRAERHHLVVAANGRRIEQAAVGGVAQDEGGLEARSQALRVMRDLSPSVADHVGHALVELRPRATIAVQSGMSIDQRIIELEIRIAHQDKVIAALDEVVGTFAARVERLEQQLDGLRTADAGPDPVGPPDEPPPHY